MFKSGFIALVGAPNVGKSTLLNKIIGQKVAITSPKAQTTRNVIRGIYNDEDSQIIFIDTPGIHKPRQLLGEVMNSYSLQATRDVEGIVVVVDGSKPIKDENLTILNKIKKVNCPIYLVVNKIDIINKEQLLLIVTEYETKFNFNYIVPLSAKFGDNLSRLISLIKSNLASGPKYYPDDISSSEPEKFIVAELVREKVLLFTQEEVPHSVATYVEQMRIKRGILYLNVAIVVERKSQKGILIGKEGSMLKKIGTYARADIEKLLGNKVMLELFVLIKEDWRSSRSHLKQLGFNIEK